MLDGPATPNRVSGQRPQLHHVSRWRLANDRRRDGRILHDQLLRRGGCPSRDVENLGERPVPPERRYGMDNDHYDWLPIVKREPLTWPDGARVAFCTIVNLEHMEWTPPADSYQPPGLFSHYAMQRPMAEFWTVSHREYGHRIGVFRVLDLLERHGIRAT